MRISTNSSESQSVGDYDIRIVGARQASADVDFVEAAVESLAGFETEAKRACFGVVVDELTRRGIEGPESHRANVDGAAASSLFSTHSSACRAPYCSPRICICEVTIGTSIA